MWHLRLETYCKKSGFRGFIAKSSIRHWKNNAWSTAVTKLFVVKNYKQLTTKNINILFSLGCNKKADTKTKTKCKLSEAATNIMLNTATKKLS